ASSFARFAFGSPLVIVYIIALHGLAGLAWPTPNLRFVAWGAVGGVSQIFATSCLIYLFSFRNFAVGVAYSKTEVIQAAIFGLLFLDERLTVWGAPTNGIRPLGVTLISLTSGLGFRAILSGW